MRHTSSHVFHDDGAAVRTALTDLVGLEHPVMLAGMGGVSYAELVAAVSAAGGSWPRSSRRPRRASAAAPTC